MIVPPDGKVYLKYLVIEKGYSGREDLEAGAVVLAACLPKIHDHGMPLPFYGFYAVEGVGGDLKADPLVGAIGIFFNDVLPLART